MTFNIDSDFISDFLKLLSAKNYLIEFSKAWIYVLIKRSKMSIYYMKHKKNMAQTLIFVFALIIILSPFLVVANRGMSFSTPFSSFLIYTILYHLFIIFISFFLI